MNYIEENAKEPRKIDYDLEQVLVLAGVPRDSIKDILAAVYGENDGADWHYIVVFKDGSYGYLTGGCDYTGWDCQASATLVVQASSLELVLSHVPTKEEFYDRPIHETVRRQLAHELPFGVIETKP